MPSTCSEGLKARRFFVNESTTQIFEVRSVIARLLPTGHPTLELVAKQLDISPRTLQRHLAKQGLTHSKLVYQVRITRACQQLSQSNLQISEIASEIGFASPSAFSHAFQSWTGTSPRSFRKGTQELSKLENEFLGPD